MKSCLKLNINQHFIFAVCVVKADNLSLERYILGQNASKSLIRQLPVIWTIVHNIETSKYLNLLMTVNLLLINIAYYHAVAYREI